MNEPGSQPLARAKHEQFCQLFAQGSITRVQAFTAAGYKRTKYSHQRARSLAINQLVRERIAYLQSLAAEHTVVTLEGLIIDARRLMKKAEQLEQLGPAVGALKELGILCGFRVEKREQKLTTQPEQLTDEELRAIAALGRPQLSIEHEPSTIEPPVMSSEEMASAKQNEQTVDDAA